MKTKLTLDEKYQYLVKLVRQSGQPLSEFESLRRNLEEHLVELSKLWFGDQSYGNAYKVIERIHSADEIEWIEHEYNWRLKSEKVFSRYIWLDRDGLNFGSADCAYSDDVMTESEFKKLLEGTGLPFEAFEKVEADD